MNKRILCLSLLSFSGLMLAQVGINNPLPKATLDITAKTLTGNSTDNPEGIIAPRLTGDQIKAKDALYGTDQIGIIIYATNASSDAGVASTKTINVTTAGYYYFDGSIWQKITGQEPWNLATTTTPASSNIQNIYQMGSVGVGIASPTGKLNVIETITADKGTKWPNIYGIQTVALGSAFTGSSYRAAELVTTVDPISSTTFSNNSLMGARIQALDASLSTYTGVNGAIYGLYSSVEKSGLTGGSVPTMKGIQNYTIMQTGSNSTAASIWGIHNRLDLFSGQRQPIVYGILNEVRGNASNSFGTYKGITSDVLAQFTVDNFYAFYVGTGLDNYVSSTNKWAFYSDTKIPSYFKGNVGIGESSFTPQAKLHVVKSATDITPVIVVGLPVYASEGAATSDTALPSGGLFKISSSNVLYVKP